MKPILVVGAGLSGAVIARRLVEGAGALVDVIDSRTHVAGNCHTERDARSGVMVHVYGPHIFNTDIDHVWNYVQRFATFRPYVNRVKAVTERGVFSLPLNLHTINQFYGTAMNPREAMAFVASQGDQSILEPANFEEQAVKMVGWDMYRTFFRGYTIKQWGCDPRDLPASILKRLPLRFNYDDSYYRAKHQGIPEEGYTCMVSNMLDHDRIRVHLGTPHGVDMNKSYAHVFYTGAIDAYFRHEHGRLGYRTVEFEKTEAEGDYQGNAVINYTSEHVPYTRVHEHKHFAPWESHERTVVFREYSRATGPGDIPFYPLRLRPDMELLEKYTQMACELRGVTFAGRLGTYEYLDMDDVIDLAQSCADRFLATT